jgi:shikimate dehydrogenase
MIHQYWLKQFGIEGSYERIPVEPENLEAFLNALTLSGFAGCNVTIPHKENTARIIPNTDERVRRIGSANTVYLKQGELCATSTDGVGFCRNVEETCNGIDWKGLRVTVIGAGGSASAIVDEILRRGAHHIHLTNRTAERASELAKRFGDGITAHPLTALETLLPATDLLINTTSVGLAGKGEFQLDLARLPQHAIVADINYAPLKTKFLTNAETAGYRIVTGLGMLLHQAIPGFELWFGVRPTVTRELHDLVARDIDPDYQR